MSALQVKWYLIIIIKIAGRKYFSSMHACEQIFYFCGIEQMITEYMKCKTLRKKKRKVSVQQPFQDFQKYTEEKKN